MIKRFIEEQRVENIQAFVLHDKNLSWKAKGILCYLLKLKPGSYFSPDDLVEKGTDGITSINAGINELIQEGYLKRETEREGGKIVGMSYILLDPLFME